MVAVLLVPVVVLLVPCLLALLERRVVAEPVAARAPVVPLHAAPSVDGDTPPLRRAS